MKQALSCATHDPNATELLGLSAEALIQPYALVTETKRAVKYKKIGDPDQGL
jgi:hypothetical protein